MLDGLVQGAWVKRVRLCSVMLRYRISGTILSCDYEYIHWPYIHNRPIMFPLNSWNIGLCPNGLTPPLGKREVHWRYRQLISTIRIECLFIMDSEACFYVLYISKAKIHFFMILKINKTFIL